MKENIMKPRHNKGGLPDCDKRALIQTRATPCASQTPRVKPFTGKVFYLDLTSNKVAETLESDIELLGGTVEKFFSKDIKYLVSNKREAKYVQCLRQDSPAPSPESGPSSPQLCSGDGTKSTSQLQKDTVSFVSSVGKSLVKKVVKEQERIRMNKILSNALEWGVKILYLDGKLSAIKMQAGEAVLIKYLFCDHYRMMVIIFCLFFRHYRPFYLRLTNVPEFTLSTHPPCTPFCLENKDAAGNRTQRGARALASDERPNERKKKKLGGYCECCLLKYDNITTHLQSDRHKTFAKSDEYFIVDKLVSAMHCNFIPFRNKLKKPKCSVSSVLSVPGPFVDKPRAEDGVDSVVKLELFQSQNHERREEQSSIPPLKTTAAAPSVCHKTNKRRKNSTFSDSKRKQPPRHTFTSNIKEQRPHRNEELAPPTGASPAPHPGFSEAHLSLSHSTEALGDVNSKTEPLSQTLNETNPETKLESGLCTAAHRRMLVHKQSTENYVSLKGGSSEDFVPEEMIKRKIKVYKRKRQKMLGPLVSSLSMEQSD
ncbi:hypothetical protein NQD34_012248, partial [Periophthalmus magnuspinnatus]